MHRTLRLHVLVLKNCYRDQIHQIVGNSTVGHYEYDYSESRSLPLVAQISSSKFPFRECLFIQMGSAVIFHKLLWPIDSGILLQCSFPQEAGRKKAFIYPKGLILKLNYCSYFCQFLGKKGIQIVHFYYRL